MAQGDAGSLAAWTVLGLGPGATRSEIARAYRLRARATHPDASGAPDAATRFDELVTAYHQALGSLEHPTTTVDPVPEPKTPRAAPGRSAYAADADPPLTTSLHTDTWWLIVGPATVSPIPRATPRPSSGSRTQW